MQASLLPVGEGDASTRCDSGETLPFVADELVEVFHLLAEGNGVGRVLGVRPGGEASVDIELLMIWRIGDNYRLRSAVVGLDGLSSARGHLFEYPPPAALPFEDVEFSTLDEALTSAGTLVRASRAHPIPGHGAWLTRSEFVERLARSALRSEISWRPQPPHWWDATRKVLNGSGTVALVVVPPFITWWVFDRFGWWEWDDDWGSLLAVVVWVVLGVLLALLSEPCERALDGLERRLERHRDVPGPSASDADAPSPRQERPGPALDAVDGTAEASHTHPPAHSQLGTDSKASPSEVNDPPGSGLLTRGTASLGPQADDLHEWPPEPGPISHRHVTAAVQDGLPAVQVQDVPADPPPHEIPDSATAQDD